MHAALEGRELVVRGAVRKRVAFEDLANLTVRSATLVCDAAGEHVELDLGAERARTWARTIASPATPLHEKLGITRTTKLFVSGTIDDASLAAAIAESDDAKAPLADAEMAIARVDDSASLTHFIERIASAANLAAIWVVYTKGPNAPLGETATRTTMRASGFNDTKVAAVSEKLTALRFSRRTPTTASARPKHRSLKAKRTH